jgi:hypothetical protein
MIESCFDKLKNVEAVIRESSSLASKKRKNKDRTIHAITPMSSMKY